MDIWKSAINNSIFHYLGDLMENRTLFLRVRVITENRIHIL